MGEYVISKDGQNYLPQDKEYIKGKEEIEEILAILPKEIELPEEFDKDYGFCHDGFKISKEEKDQEIQEEREEEDYDSDR